MKKRILVVDIPSDATAEQVESLLNAPYESGYYLTQLTATRDVSVRVEPEKE